MMKDYCDKCQRQVSFSKGFKQWYNPDLNKFWSAYICDKCGVLVSWEEHSIDFTTLIDRRPNFIFLVGLIFGIFASIMLISISGLVILSIACIVGVVVVVTVSLYILGYGGRAKRVTNNPIMEYTSV